MKRKPEYINKWLLPISWIYGLVIFMRNKFFDWGIFKEKQYDVHIISVGNLTVGGTGKTPHIEYLVNLLKDKHKVAVLSRGYKRKTKGFVLATPESTYKDIGDESMQIKLKFPDVIVAVAEKRGQGINKLLELKEKPDVILLDDAFQHRYVKPSYSILLTDYYRPMNTDALLPAGRLREPITSAERANMVIVTKCPQDLKPIDIRILTHEMNVFPYQILLFTTFKYGNLVSLFNKKDLFNREEMPLENIKGKKVLLITGIASPQTIYEKLGKYTKNVKLMEFPDHHNFTADDIKKMGKAYREMDDKKVVTIVTEKDAIRLMNRNDIDKPLADSMYYLPIKVTFVSQEEKYIFDKNLNQHVRKDPRNLEIH